MRDRKVRFTPGRQAEADTQREKDAGRAPVRAPKHLLVPVA